MNTAWREDPNISDGFAHQLAQRGYVLWTRICEDDVIFTVVKHGAKPGPNDGGYRYLETALRMKGVGV